MIRYLDGLREEFRVETIEQAQTIIRCEFPFAFFGEWEDVEDGVRMPVWEDKASSEDNDGDNAIAYIVEEVA